MFFFLLPNCFLMTKTSEETIGKTGSIQLKLSKALYEIYKKDLTFFYTILTSKRKL